MTDHSYLLSICINTRNRARLLIETLNSIRSFQSAGIEIIIMDGASREEDKKKTQEYVSDKESMTYIYSEKEIGIDEGYDLSVNFAKGKYCWLLPDDDLIFSDRIPELLEKLSMDYDLVLANLDCWTKELDHSLNQHLFQVEHNTEFNGTHSVDFWRTCGVPLSYIGSIIVKRKLWLEIDKKDFYGSYFAHIQVIMNNAKIKRTILLSNPIIKYRSGNSSWTERSFEIWNFLWPELIWSNPNLSPDEKLAVVPKEPWRRVLSMIKSRAMGEFNSSIYEKFLKPKLTIRQRFIFKFIAILPCALLNYLILGSLVFFKPERKYSIYNLAITNPQYKKLKEFLAHFEIYV